MQGESGLVGASLVGMSSGRGGQRGPGRIEGLIRYRKSCMAVEGKRRMIEGSEGEWQRREEETEGVGGYWNSWQGR